MSSATIGLALAQDSFREIRSLIRSTREERHLSRDRLADLASLHAESPIDPGQIRHIETERKTLPPRSILEPILAPLELEWDSVLRLLV